MLHKKAPGYGMEAAGGLHSSILCSFPDRHTRQIWDYIHRIFQHRYSEDDLVSVRPPWRKSTLPNYATRRLTCPPPMRLIVALLIASASLATLAWGQASGTFPGDPFNGMQIKYSLSGANITKTTDTPGYTWRRMLEGSLGNGELHVSGSATLTSGWGYTLDVEVSAGGKTKSVSFNKKVNETSNFDVSVPIATTAANGMVKIVMVGQYNAGSRGVEVWAALSQMAPIIVDKKPTPTKLSADARLKKILDRFMNEIPYGNFGSGWMNNIASWIPFTSRFDPSICGNYQAKVLALLDSIRFSDDPNVRALMEGYDYGPIQSLYGGHQAVVIYPKGKDWTVDGTVLDPWIEQRPKFYAVQDWAQMYTFGAGSYHGIGGSGVYEKNPQYPTVGGNYVDPKAKELTKEEQEWVRNLPQVDRDSLKALPDPNLRNLVIKNGYHNRKLTGVMIVNCPVNVSAINAAGQSVGYIGDDYLAQTSDATVERIKKGSGDWFTLVRFDPTQGFRAQLQATGSGPVDLVVGHGMDSDERIGSRYTANVVAGDHLTLNVAGPRAGLRSGSRTIEPTPMSKPSSGHDTKAPGTQSFAGKWQTDFGLMMLTQNGISVAGTYTWRNGSVKGTITDNILRGTWTQSSSDLGNEVTSGDFEFVLSSDGNSFAGKWRYGSGGAWQSKPWNGTRSQ